MRICQIKQQTLRTSSNESAVRHGSVRINVPQNVQAIIETSAGSKKWSRSNVNARTNWPSGQAKWRRCRMRGANIICSRNSEMKSTETDMGKWGNGERRARRAKTALVKRHWLKNCLTRNQRDICPTGEWKMEPGDCSRLSPVDCLCHLWDKKHWSVAVNSAQI